MLEVTFITSAQTALPTPDKGQRHNATIFRNCFACLGLACSQSQMESVFPSILTSAEMTPSFSASLPQETRGAVPLSPGFEEVRDRR